MQLSNKIFFVMLLAGFSNANLAMGTSEKNSKKKTRLEFLKEDATWEKTERNLNFLRFQDSVVAKKKAYGHFGLQGTGSLESNVTLLCCLESLLMKEQREKRAQQQ